jgi:hypothetical protein
MLSYEFVILEQNGTACEFALDDIYYEGNAVTAVDPPPTAAPGKRALSSSPNPFRSSTDLRFDLATAAPYAVEIFDAAGKRIAGFEGLGKAGANTVRWNGLDAQGRLASPGVYYYRMRSGAQSSVLKLVLLK